MSEGLKPTPEQEKMRDMILDEHKKGNVVFWGLPSQLMVAPLDEFVQQPAEGMLYDLNRLEEISLTFLPDPKWVNDFAVALVIRKLVEQRDALRSPAPVGWVACSERLPEDEGEYLVMRKGIRETNFYRASEKAWIRHSPPFDRYPTISHWMPLPEPPAMLNAVE